MNYIKHLTAFFDISDNDARITPFHISLYLSLFRCWNLNFFNNPVSIARSEMMKMAKIGSVNTYVKCLNELHKWKYIQYEPSYNRHKGSMVYLYTFDNSTDNACDMPVIPSINNINNTNNSNFGEQAQNFKKLELVMEKKKNNEKEKLREKKKNLELNRPAENFPPPLEHIIIYFSEKGADETEAQKFFNHFESNGWLVGGRAKMKDWKAAARNWILNIPKFQARQQPYKNRATILNTSKNYNEPL